LDSAGVRFPAQVGSAERGAAPCALLRGRGRPFGERAAWTCRRERRGSCAGAYGGAAARGPSAHTGGRSARMQWSLARTAGGRGRERGGSGAGSRQGSGRRTAIGGADEVRRASAAGLAARRSGGEAEQIADALARAFDLGPLRTVIASEPRFACRCSRERVVRALRSLGATPLREMAEKDRGARLTCDFCNAAYSFSASE